MNKEYNKLKKQNNDFNDKIDFTEMENNLEIELNKLGKLTGNESNNEIEIIILEIISFVLKELIKLDIEPDILLNNIFKRYEKNNSIKVNDTNEQINYILKIQKENKRNNLTKKDIMKLNATLSYLLMNFYRTKIYNETFNKEEINQKIAESLANVLYELLYISGLLNLNIENSLDNHINNKIKIKNK